MMADVFLSYARPSEDQAMRVAAMLGEQGFSVWFDQRLPAHRPYADVIAAELDAAAAVLVLWTDAAARSQWVRSEANRARETGRLVQARLDDTRLPMPFDQLQCADLRRWSGSTAADGWRNVTTSIAALAGTAVALPPPAPTSPYLTRRRMLIGGGSAAAVVGASFAGWHLLSDPEASPQARLLLQKGLDSLQDNDALETEDPGTTAQAIALLTDATEADPGSATAWGGLAMAYAVRSRASAVADRAGVESRSRSSAEQALDLDPKEPRALAALRMIDPVYRHWLRVERADRQALRYHPRVPILSFILSEMLGSVGRWREAAELSRAADRTNFLIPGADRKLIVNLWSAGDLQGADSALRIAIERWPEHPQVWRTRLAYLLYSGRPTEALDLLGNERQRPATILPELIAAARATGMALAGHGDAASATAANLDYLKVKPIAAPQVAQAFAAIGDASTALALLTGYYFSAGPWASLAPPGGDADRVTAPLFQPPMRRLWRDPRFDTLLERIGLDEYWRTSRTRPDYRRPA